MAGRRDLGDTTPPGRLAARELLRRACFSDLENFRESLTGSLPGCAIDWPYAIETGSRHGLLCLLEYALRQVPASLLNAIPGDVRRHLMAVALDAERATRRRAAFLKTLLDALGGRGVPAMVEKGLALSGLYPEPRLRPFGDIDLLVHEQDWPAVAEVLDGLGMRPLPGRTLAPRLSPEHVLHMVGYVAYGEVQYASPCDVMLEVHFRVFNVGIPSPVEDAWERQRIERVADIDLPTLGFEDAVLFHAVHANWHRFCRLIWLADLHRMLRSWAGRMDWAWLIRRAREQKMSWPLACAIELAQDLGGPVAGVPAIRTQEPLERWRRRGYYQRWMSPRIRDLEQDSNFAFDPLWFYLRETATWPDRLRFLYRATFPPRACLGGEGYWSYWTRLAVDRFPWSEILFGPGTAQR